MKCECCKYVRADKKASKRKWTAYKCGNKESEFYGSLLNVTYNGNELKEVCWIGCKCGKYSNAMEIRLAVEKLTAAYNLSCE